MLSRIDYLTWLDGRPEAAVHDLGSSHLRRSPGGTVVPAALEGLPDPDDAALEELLAVELGVPESTVLVTAGATAANLAAFAAALPGRVLVEKPAYEPLVATPRGLDATVDRFVRPREDGWPLEPDRVDAAAVEDTTLAVVTNRHNPSARLADRETLAAAAAAAREVDARLLVDEVYAPFGADGDRGGADGGAGTAFGGPTAAGLDGAVVTGSLTKFLGLGALRIGWLVADEPFRDAAAAASQHLAAVSEPSRALARRALANADALSERSRELAAENAAQLRSFVDGRADLTATIPEGCPFGLAFHESADGDAVAGAAWDAGVLVVPGRFFGVDEGVRVSACGDPDEMAAALDAFGAALDGL